jgi:hypothetical protein
MRVVAEDLALVLVDLEVVEVVVRVEILQLEPVRLV